MQRLSTIVKTWLVVALVVSLVSGILYAAVQQVLRMNANDPQIEMAEDIAAALTQGESPDTVVPEEPIDIATSLAAFVVVYDDSGMPVAGSGMLHDELPAMPKGVLDYVRKNGENRITWQPEPGIRSATVITRFRGDEPGFVMAGRSLREVESRTTRLGYLIGLGAVGSIFVALAVLCVIELVFAGGAAVGSRMGKRRNAGGQATAENGPTSRPTA